MKITQLCTNVFLGKILARIGRYKNLYSIITLSLKEQLGYMPNEKQIYWCLGDYYKFKKIYGGSIDVDYFGTQMYRKSDFVRRDSFANNSRFKWRDDIQEQRLKMIFEDKRLFYKSFSNWLNRNWMIVDEDTTFDKFKEFVKDLKNEVVVKVPDGYGGKGVEFHKLTNDRALRDLYELCYKKQLIVEEKIAQCEELKVFSPLSVNTFRIVTIIDTCGKAHVARAVLRIGRGSSGLDNFSSGGMGAQVDVKTGVIYTTAMDKAGHEYIFHPETGKQIVGYKIEDWDEYKNFVLELAMQYPTVRYVGWDVVKDVTGKYCVIEGNGDAGFDVMEAPLLYGLKPQYNALLKGIEL